MWWCAFIANARGLILAWEAAFCLGDSTWGGDAVRRGEAGREVRTRGRLEGDSVG